MGIEPFIDYHEWVDICADCSEVFSELKRKKPALADSFLTAEQIKLVIEEHSSHQTHVVDWDKAAQFAIENLKWEKSKAAYWPLYHRAKSLKRQFDELKTKLGTDENDTLDALAKQVRNDFPDLEWHELLGYLHDVLEDEKRWPER